MSDEPPSGGTDPRHRGGYREQADPQAYARDPEGRQYGGPGGFDRQRDMQPGGGPYDGYPPAAAAPGPGTPPIGGTSPDPLVPFSFGDWVSKVIGTVRRSWRPLLTIEVIVLLPVAILSTVQLVLPYPAEASPVVDPMGIVSYLLFSLLIALVGGLLWVLGQAAVAFVVVRDAARRPYSTQQVLAFVRARAWPMIGWWALAYLLCVVGTIVLVLPGVYLAMVFFAALTGAVVIERADMGRAFTLVNARLLPVLGRGVALVLAAVAYGLFVGLLVAGITLLSGVVGQFLYTLLMLPAAVVFAAASIVTYAELRFHEHNPVHTPVLADEIDRP